MTTNKNKKRLNQLFKLVTELALITLGIYLALFINNWNESKKEQELEQFYLNNLLTDVDRSISSLQRHWILDSVQLIGAKRLDQLLDEGHNVDMDSLRIYLNFFNTNPRFEIPNFSYQALLQSGDYQVIRNKELRHAMDEFFLDLLSGVVITEGYYIDRLNEYYFPVKETVYMAKSNSFINIERLFHPVFKENVYALPAYINQEMRQIKRALEASQKLRKDIQLEIN